MTSKNRIKGAIWGALVGDALGVPVEFKSRTEIAKNPVTDMIGYGTYNKPPGTWSDDGSMILCSIDSLISDGFDIVKMSHKFEDWLYHGLWTTDFHVFDVGITTSRAIARITNGISPLKSGATEIHENGNGSLMRIIPVIIAAIKEYDDCWWDYLQGKSKFTKEVADKFRDSLYQTSAITHGHEYSKIACEVFGQLIMSILYYGGKPAQHVRGSLSYVADRKEHPVIAPLFKMMENMTEPENTGGFVVDTLVASMWCFMQTDSYSDAVLKAVNLGEDTDTNGCVTGALAGWYYGYDAIPQKWLDTLPRQGDLHKLIDIFVEKYHTDNPNVINNKLKVSMINKLKMVGWILWYFFCMVLIIMLFITTLGILMALAGPYIKWIILILLLTIIGNFSYQLAKHKLGK